MFGTIYKKYTTNYKFFNDIIEKYLLTETQEISKKISADYGEAWEFEYEIISEKKLDKEVVEQIANDLEKATSREMKVKKAYKINISYAISGTKTSENFASFTAVKIDSDWYAVETYPEIGWRITVLEF